MRWLYKIPLRFRSLFHKSRVEKELTEELSFHLEKLMEEKVRKGMTPEEARYAALRDLGGVEKIKAVAGADIVVGCAPIVKNPKPVVPPQWLKPGSVAVSLDFDATLTAAAAHAADDMLVDDGAQFEYYRQNGHFTDFPTRYNELATLIASHQGRRNEAERYVVVNLGHAVEDMATALPLYRRGLEREVGTLLPC